MRIVRNIMLVMAVAFVGLNASAQETKTEGKTEKKARLTLAVTAGANTGAAITAPAGTLATYGIEAPSANWMNKGLSFGIEGGILIGPHWRINLGGGFNFASNPKYSEVPGTADPNATAEENWGEVPNYSAVSLQQSLAYTAFVGTDYIFNIPAVPALKPYIGIRFAGAYASNQKETDTPLAMGSSIAESFALRASLMTGADYYISDAFFIGIGFDFASYTYSVNVIKPQQGLKALGADSHNIGAFAQPMLKIGVRF